MVVDRGQAVAAAARVAQLAGRRRRGLVGQLAPAGQGRPVAVLERPRAAALVVGEVDLGGHAGVDGGLVGGQVGDQAAVGQRLGVLVDDEHAAPDAGAGDHGAGASGAVAVGPEVGGPRPGARVAGGAVGCGRGGGGEGGAHGGSSWSMS